MRAGFTLIEVVVALVVLEVAVVGVLGSLVLSADIMRHAEAVEYATARAEGVLDSLRGGSEQPGQGAGVLGQERLEWAVEPDGSVRIVVVNERDGELVLLCSWISVR